MIEKIPSGTAMMLKAFGFNADEIVGKVAEFGQIMAEIARQLAVIQRQQHLILERLEHGATSDKSDDRSRSNGKAL